MLIRYADRYANRYVDRYADRYAVHKIDMLYIR